MTARIVAGARAAAAEPGCRAAIELIAVVALLGLALHRPGAGHGRPYSTGWGAASGGHRHAGHRAGGGRGGRRPGPARRWPSGSAGGPCCRRRPLRLPVLLVLYGLAPTLWLSAVAFLAVGAGYIAVLSGLNTVVQLRAPAEARGRILAST